MGFNIVNRINNNNNKKRKNVCLIQAFEIKK